MKPLRIRELHKFGDKGKRNVLSQHIVCKVGEIQEGILVIIDNKSKSSTFIYLYGHIKE